VFPIPAVAEPLALAIRDAAVFTRPTYRRFLGLMLGLIVTMGRRTVSHALAVMRPTALGRRLPGHWSDYHRLFSAARFSMWTLAAVLVRQVVMRLLLPANAVIELAADDTVLGKDGDHVWAKAAHRDPTRSSRKKAAIRFGHKWLALCVLVQLPGLDRPWALPILCGLCLSPKAAAKVKRRPKTPSQLARQLLMRLMRWLPDRRFILIGDYQIVTHQTAEFARRHADRVTAIGRLRGDANLYAQPVCGKARGPSQCGPRHPRKGAKLPAPAKQIATLQSTTQEVTWYGGSRRSVRYVSEQALWYDKHGSPLPGVTPIRWVCVLGDAKHGTDDAFFFSTDASAMDAATIIELYARRWNIEVTFEESRALLGLETTRQWCRRSVLRVTPILLGLFTAVALLWRELPASKRRMRWGATPCYQKRSITFVDALAAVRRELWQEALLAHRCRHRCLDRLPAAARRIILWHLAVAA
jgi:hypothetical protein